MYESDYDKQIIDDINFYLDQHNGRMPDKFDYGNDKEREIAQWLMTKRSRLQIGSISDEEINILRRANIDYGLNLYNWDDWYNLLSAYIDANAVRGEDIHIPELLVIDKNYKLGKWTKRQINNFSKLSDEQKDKLKSLRLKEIKEIKEKEIRKNAEIAGSADKKRFVMAAKAADKERREMRRHEKQEEKQDIINLIQDKYNEDIGPRTDISISIFRIEYGYDNNDVESVFLYLSIENHTDVCTDVSIMSTSLIQNNRHVAFRYYLAGYVMKNATIIPCSCRTVGRIYDRSSLTNKRINSGDVFEVLLKDDTRGIVYVSKFMYDDKCGWKNTYLKTRNYKVNEYNIVSELMKYRKWIEEGYINEKDYEYIKHRFIDEYICTKKSELYDSE